MADKKPNKLNTEHDKRKRSETSSISEIDSSINEEKPTKESNLKQKKKKSKANTDSDSELEEMDKNTILKEVSKINTKLAQVENSMKGVNKQLENVLIKDDTSLKETLKNFLFEIKEDLLKSVNKSIEVLEGKLFDKEKMCDNLQLSVDKLDKALDEQKDTIEFLRNEITKSDNARKKGENDAEQYSRRNNLKISGIEDNNPDETARETASKVIHILHEKKIYDLKMEEIDITHRLPNKNNKNRDIIIRFISRNTKVDIITNRKKLKGTGIFISEDLTRLNVNVYMSVKRKMSDEVEQVWTKNGTIIYKNKIEQIKVVKFDEFDHWLDLPWPEKK